MNALPNDLFSELFSNWVACLQQTSSDIVAIDGKTSRRSHGNGHSALHLVSAWASQQRLVLGQQACGEKDNEISVIPDLLSKLELTGALVTIDAMGCQQKIAKAIRASGADYLLALKANQKTMHEEVVYYFDQEQDLEQHSTTDGDHGRIETRTAFVSHEVDWLQRNYRDIDMPQFEGLSCLGMILSERESDGKVRCSKRYYISSLPLTAAELNLAARAHWGIENRLHWVMDVVFHDDLMRLRSQNGPANMALVRHMALNIFKQIEDKRSLKVRRKSAAWSDQYLFDALIKKAG